uniref:Uncharacterized protein n=1 Tax=Kalanchoe fedtschenkoi TaxID=63787 RepID=A0A7N0UZQ4_KALFE
MPASASGSSTPPFFMPEHTSCSSWPKFATPEHDITATVRKQNLYRAAHRGDWKATIDILSQDSTLRNAELNGESATALHVAVGTGKAIHYVEELVKGMRPMDLEKKDRNGQTPLMIAAIIGNIEAAKLLVRRNQGLLYLCGNKGLLPVHIAAQYGQKDMLLYLLKVTRSDDPSRPYASKSGAQLLHYIIQAEFYDVATSLVSKYPELIDESYTISHSVTPPLTVLATNPSAFQRYIHQMANQQ